MSHTPWFCRLRCACRMSRPRLTWLTGCIGTWTRTDTSLKPCSDITSDERAAVDTYFRDRAILTPLNEHVDALNLEFLARLSGEETVTRSRDSIVEDDVDGHTYTTELLNRLNPPGCAPHELKLKKGAVVLLTHNIDRERGLCNGTRAIVVSVAPRVLVVRVLTGRAKGQTVELPRTRQTMEGTKTKMPFNIRRVQFPVKLAWVMTINKSQGQTLLRDPRALIKYMTLSKLLYLLFF